MDGNEKSTYLSLTFVYASNIKNSLEDCKVKVQLIAEKLHLSLKRERESSSRE